MHRNCKGVIAIALACLMATPGVAEMVTEKSMRKNGELLPKVKHTDRTRHHRWQTTIRALRGDIGFRIDGKFDNIHKIEGSHLCSGVLFFDTDGRLMVTAVMRKLVPGTYFGRTQIKRDAKLVAMAPQDVADVASVEVWHDRCPDNDFRKRLKEMAEDSKRAAEIAKNAQAIAASFK